MNLMITITKMCDNTKSLVKYGTAQLQLHFYTRVHAWHHTVFRVEVAYFFRGNTYLHATRRGTYTLRDMAFPQDVAFLRDVAFPRDVVMITEETHEIS